MQIGGNSSLGHVQKMWERVVKMPHAGHAGEKYTEGWGVMTIRGLYYLTIITTFTQKGDELLPQRHQYPDLSLSLSLWTRQSRRREVSILVIHQL